MSRQLKRCYRADGSPCRCPSTDLDVCVPRRSQQHAYDAGRADLSTKIVAELKRRIKATPLGKLLPTAVDAIDVVCGLAAGTRESDAE